MTELIWDGKYDQDGKKVAPLRVALPFQTVETINESAQERQKMLDMFSTGRDPEWRNRLIWGDNKYVLPALVQELAGQVDLIYIDPPFDTGADFSFDVAIDGEDFTKEPSIIEMKAYRDTWGKGVESYVHWFYQAGLLLHGLLREAGSLYVHLDWHVCHYAKVVLDEIFGQDNFRNEIIWKSTSAHSDSTRYGSNHQTLLFYTKGPGWTWNRPLMDYDPEYVEQYYRYKEPGGRRFKSGDLSAYGLQGGGYTYKWHEHTKPWRVPIETMQRLDQDGKIFYTKNGVARLKSYLDETEGMPAQTIWTDKAVQYVVSWGDEKLPFDTQKSEALLRRIISASSDEGDLVLDCFAGSGTTPATAEKLNRRWIACDLGRFAIHTTRKRLLSLPDTKSFVVQNLGKYERQLWQAAEFGESAQQKTEAYRRFILDLYKAAPITGYSWLHGVKGGRMVHVGAVDSPVTPADLSQVAAEFKKSIGTGKDAPTTNGVDVLGWDFAFDMNEGAKQQAAQANINVRLLRIPRDVMDKRAVEQGDVRFFELAALAVDVKPNGMKVDVTLTDFVIPPDDVPEDVQKAITHWEQWIDYWAVDWDYKADTFHNQWQDYRTRKKRELLKSTNHTYDEPGEYTVVVKVIDILGNDTTKTIKVKVGGDGPKKASPARAARPARSAR
ncbi:MAG: DNA methyltransferase [Dehalococcoidia bacterium]